MADASRGGSEASTSSLKPLRKKSKWDDVDNDEPSPPKTSKKRKVKTFSTSLHASTPASSNGDQASPRRDGGSSAGSTPRPGGSSRSNLIGTSGSRHPLLAGCRSVYNYERLNHIEEGSYGVVSRARDKETGDIVALKKLKMDQEKNGFPITSLREIRTLMTVGNHENIVRVREIVVGDTLTQSVEPQGSSYDNMLMHWLCRVFIVMECAESIFLSSVRSNSFSQLHRARSQIPIIYHADTLSRFRSQNSAPTVVISHRTVSR